MTDAPERAVWITCLQGQDRPIIFLEEFEHGDRRVRIMFQPDNLDEFFATASANVSIVLRSMRQISYVQSEGAKNEHMAPFLN